MRNSVLWFFDFPPAKFCPTFRFDRRSPTEIAQCLVEPALQATVDGIRYAVAYVRDYTAVHFDRGLASLLNQVQSTLQALLW